MNFIENAKQIGADKKVKFVSFDCFDTLLSRKVARPVDVFVVLAAKLKEEQLLPAEISNQRFRGMRARAEHQAREISYIKYGHREIGLGDIYENLHCIDEVNKPRAAALEHAVEKTILFPNDFVVGLLQELSSPPFDKKIIVTSDTYFDVRQLKSFLPTELIQRLHAIYVSSEHGCGKYSGLFEIVHCELECKPDEIAHFGDNYHSDVICAKECGMNAALLPNGTSYTWGAAQRDEAFRNNGLIRSPHEVNPVISTLETLRHKIAHLGEMGRDCNHFNFGASILGPLFFALIAKIKNYEANSGRPMVAAGLVREGRFIADLYNAAFKTSVMNEIGLSRYVTRRATLHNITASSLTLVAASRGTPILGNYLASLGLNPAVAKDLAKILGVDPNLPCPLAVIHKINQVLCGNSIYSSVIEGYSRGLRKRIIRHIEGQVGVRLSTMMSEKIPLVLSDVGWGCTVQSDLSQIFSLEGYEIEIHGFYLAINDRGDRAFTSNSKTYGAIFDNESEDPATTRLLRVLEIFEQSGTPPLGSIKDITEDGSVIIGEDGRTEGQLEDIGNVQRGISEYCQLASSQFDKGFLIDQEVEGYLRSVAAGYIYSPLADEINLFKGWIHDDNLAGDSHEPILAEEDAKVLPYFSVQQITELSMSDSYWPFASLREVDPTYSDAVNFSLLKGLPPSVAQRGSSISVTISAHDHSTEITVCPNLNSKVMLEFPIGKAESICLSIAPGQPDLVIDWIRFLSNGSKNSLFGEELDVVLASRTLVSADPVVLDFRNFSNPFAADSRRLQIGFLVLPL